MPHHVKYMLKIHDRINIIKAIEHAPLMNQNQNNVRFVH